MKTSELIALLEASIAEQGDLEIVAECSACGSWSGDFQIDRDVAVGLGGQPILVLWEQQT